MASVSTISGRVVKQAEDLFNRYGYSKTTADEIARSAGISKRTLYKYFDGKQDVLEKMVEEKMHHLKHEIRQVLEEPVVFPEKLRKVISLVVTNLSGVSRHFLEDLRRNVPETWQKLSDFRKEMVEIYYTRILDEGIAAGHFKPGINRGVAVLVMLSAMEHVINPSTMVALPSDLADSIPANSEMLFDEMIRIIYEGILAGDPAL